jgi:hypothetical protein
MTLRSWLRLLSTPAPPRRVAKVDSVTYDEEKIGNMVNTALLAVYHAETTEQLGLLEMELQQLRKQVDLRVREQMHVLQPSVRSQYKAAINTIYTLIDQCLLECERKRYLLSHPSVP